MNLKAIKTTLMGLAGAIVLAGCQKELSPPAADNTPNLRPLTVQEEKTISSSNNFAFRLFSALHSGQPAQNVFVSPLSLSSALTMTFNGADGTTKEAMRQTLGFAPQTDGEINQSFKSLQQLLTGLDRKVNLTTANAIWYARQLTLQPPFAELNKNYFDATVQGLDFSSPDAKNTINDWVEDKTQGRIKDLVQQVRHDHIMFLVNALYFKGTWTYPFDVRLTQKAPFRQEDGSTTQADFMTMKAGKYLYHGDANKKIIDLPYGNGQFSMTLIVPEGQNTVGDITRELDSSQLAAWLSLADTTRMELHLPKFKLEYEKDMREILTQLGMGVAFSEQADFSRMVSGAASGLAISEVKHKTFLEVNEEGTEAAAATSVGIIVVSLPPSIRVDRPFVFLIREKSSNAILFMGQLMNP